MSTAIKRNPSTGSIFVSQPSPRRPFVAASVAPAPLSPSHPLLQPSSISLPPLPYRRRSTSSAPLPNSPPAATVADLLLGLLLLKVAITLPEDEKSTEKASDESDRGKKLLKYGDVIVNLFPVLEIAKTWKAIIVALIIALLVFGGTPSVVPYLLITLCMGLSVLDFAVSQEKMFPVLASLLGFVGKACVLFVVPFIISKILSEELAWIPLVSSAVFLMAQPICGCIHMVLSNRKVLKLRMKKELKG